MPFRHSLNFALSPICLLAIAIITIVQSPATLAAEDSAIVVEFGGTVLSLSGEPSGGELTVGLIAGPDTNAVEVSIPTHASDELIDVAQRLTEAMNEHYANEVPGNPVQPSKVSEWQGEATSLFLPLYTDYYIHSSDEGLNFPPAIENLRAICRKDEGTIHFSWDPIQGAEESQENLSITILRSNLQAGLPATATEWVDDGTSWDGSRGFDGVGAPIDYIFIVTKQTPIEGTEQAHILNGPPAWLYTIEGPHTMKSQTFSIDMPEEGYLSSTEHELVEFNQSGGVHPLDWSIIEGELPPGMQLDKVRYNFAGHATKSGSFPITLQCQDAEGNTLRHKLNIIVTK